MSRQALSSAVSDLSQRLAARGQRATAQRLVVLEALRRTDHTITAPELYGRLRRQNPLLGRATVFRTLDSLVDAGLAQRFERPGHIYAYAACSTTHHHHLVCTRCDTTIEIDEAAIAVLTRELEARHAFTVHHGTLDFYGFCAACSGEADVDQ
ncbi:MAG: Fur family transcriptional regulator [Candidatus Dormibacteria bacterium]